MFFINSITDEMMSRAYIQRTPNRRRGAGGCVILALIFAVIGVVAFIVLLPLLPGFVMGTLGFRPLGQTAQVFSQPVAPPQIQVNSASAGAVDVNTGVFGTISLENAQSATVDGRESTIVRLTETQLNAMCLRTVICSTTPTQPIYNASIDLRPGGAVVRGMVYISQVGIYQEAGLAIRFDGLRASISGVDYNGTLYSLPESGLGISIPELQQRVEQGLREVTASLGGDRMTLTGMYADDSSLTLVFR